MRKYLNGEIATEIQMLHKDVIYVNEGDFSSIMQNDGISVIHTYALYCFQINGDCINSKFLVDCE